MQQNKLKILITPIIAAFIFILLVFGAAYAYITSTINMNTANYQVTLPKVTTLTCSKTDCNVNITPAMMTFGAVNATTPKGTSKCYVNCTCSGTQGATCSYNVILKEIGLPYTPSATLGTNKELTVKVTSPSGCTAQNTSGTETQINTQKNKVVSNCTLTVPASGSVSANISAEFKWYNQNLDQSKHANRLYNYRFVAGSRLPSTYQEVEYITLSGAPYIKTGFFLNPNTDGFSVTFNASTTSQNGMIVADTGGSTTTGSYIWAYYYNAGTKIGFWTKGTSASGTTTLDTNIHTMTYVNKRVYFDDTLSANWSATNFGTPNYEMLVGSNYYSGSYNYFFKGNIYEVVFYRNNAVEMDLVPAKRNDDVVGLYDVVNGDFYVNSGSGTITAGPNV